MKIVLASNNKHKVKEFQEIFLPYGVEILTLNDLNINVDPDESGKTFKENAYIKASYVAKHIDEYIIADDSGLCLEGSDVLGVKTARFRNDLDYPSRHEVVYNSGE